MKSTLEVDVMDVRAPKAPKLSRNALRVLEGRYLRRDEQRRIVESPEQLFARVAGAVASAESQTS